mgnify:CR=1 FL=1
MKKRRRRRTGGRKRREIGRQNNVEERETQRERAGMTAQLLERGQEIGQAERQLLAAED